MRQRLFNLAAAVSLMVFPSILALWARSYSLSDRINWSGRADAWAQYRHCFLLSQRGSLRLQWGVSQRTSLTDDDGMGRGIHLRAFGHKRQGGTYSDVERFGYSWLG